MDTSQEIIPGRAKSEKKPDDGICPRSPAPISTVVSKVLDVDDLLIEILLRLGFPTTLIRAALVCRRWLRHASDPAVLHRFRELHPPRLLGFYVNHGLPNADPCFVPMLPQPPELAAVIHRASSILDTDQSNGGSTSVLDCRNGNVLIGHHQDSTFRVHNLPFPERGIPDILQRQCPLLPGNSSLTLAQLLSKEEEGFGLSYLCMVMHCTAEGELTAHVYMLQDGVLHMRNSAIVLTPYMLLHSKAVLVKNKIYISAAQRDIIVFDLMASSFSKIQLPQGVEHVGNGKTMLSRPDDVDGIYLAHVKGLRLSIWLHNVSNWLLVDTICLREICDSLCILDCNASIRHVGDNAEFVFLEIGRYALFWDVKHMTLRKVYEMRNEDQSLGYVYSLMMIWPPMFPALKDDPARNTT